MQKTKKERPEDFRCLMKFGEHKKQLDNNELSNPYENEVKHFDGFVKANDEVRAAALKVPAEAMAYKTLGETPFTFVDTPDLLDEMATKLSAVTEIAIDLEHHNQRTFLGLTCLMQISTRTEDFIVDTLALFK